MAVVGELATLITARAGQFHAEMKKVGTSVQNFEKMAEKVGNGLRAVFAGLGFGGIMAGMQQAINFASQINDQAATLGISTSALQELDYAARLTGAEGGVQAITKLQDALATAVEKSGPARAAFAKLGLSAAKLKDVDISTQMGVLADAFQNLESPAERVQIAIDLFGKSGARMLPMLTQGSEGLAEMGRQATKMSDEMIQALDRAGDALDNFKLRGTVAFGHLANTASTFLERFERGAGKIMAIFASLGSGLSMQEAIEMGTGAGMGAGGSAFNDEMRRKFFEGTLADPKNTEIALKWSDSLRELSKTMQGREGTGGLMAGFGGMGMSIASAVGLAVSEARRRVEANPSTLGSVGTFNTQAAQELGRSTNYIMKDMRDNTREQVQLQEETNRILREMGGGPVFQ